MLQDGEPVGAAPRQHVAFAQGREHPGAGVAQQQVARDVPEALVDGRDIGELDAQHRGHPIAVARAVEHRLEALDKRHAVRQPGQRILRRARARPAPGRRSPAAAAARRAARGATRPRSPAQRGHHERGHRHQRQQPGRAATIGAEPAGAEPKRQRAGQAMETELDQECSAEHAYHLSRDPGHRSRPDRPSLARHG